MAKTMMEPDPGKTCVQLCDWLAFSGAADREHARDLWLEGLTFFRRLLAYTVHGGVPLGRGQKAALLRLVDSLINLICSVGWLDKARRDELCEELADLHERLQTEGK